MARMPEGARSALLSATRCKTYEPGEILMLQGDQSAHICVLSSTGTGESSACAKVSLGMENGTESLLGVRVSGDIVGESAAVRGATRSATVTTCSPVRAHVLSQKAFLEFLDKHPGSWRALTCVVVDRLEAANHRRLDFAAFNVATRLARVLVELVEQHGLKRDSGHELGVHLSQAELGTLIGAREDSINRAMGQLQRENMAIAHYRGVTVTDLHKLRAFAQLP
jgi:CRP/FNR family cyclic AMP-dependent transcriptional regulator